MKDDLEKFRETRKQRDDLGAELSELQAQLKKNIEEQELAILQSRDSLSYETEIVRLRTRIEGIGKALKSLDAVLKEMDEENAIRLREIKLEQIKQAKAECLEILADSYQLFAEGIDKLVELKAKYLEYKAGLRATKQDAYLSMKISNLLYTFQNEMPKLLGGFPQEIFRDGKLPELEELRKSLRK
jgi:hypothetical protein